MIFCWLPVALPAPQHFFLGDFTGHGLSAALGALPVADTFYDMTAQGSCISDIVRTINSKLNQLLPTGLYCAACAIELDIVNSHIFIWNGGLPDLLITSESGVVQNKVSSFQLPLGVLEDESFDSHVQIHCINDSTLLYLVSDGVIEAKNLNGEMFGEERLDAAISEHSDPETRFEQISAMLEEFCSETIRTDDITLVEISCNLKHRNISKIERGTTGQKKISDWNASFQLEATSLQSCDPVPRLMKLIEDMPGMREHRQQIHTVVTELFINALDHGVLGLDSSIKDESEGFSKYYALREQRLSSVTEGSIEVSLEHRCREGGGKLLVRIQDSGPGFDWQKILSRGNRRSGSGRGIPLVRSICSAVTFNDPGNTVEVEFDWRIAA